MASEPLSHELSVEDRVLVVFGYLGPLALVSLVATQRELVKWHAKQGLLLSGVIAGLYVIVLRPLRNLVDWYLWPVFGELFRAAEWTIVLGFAILVLVCLVRGLEGERFKIPMLGDLADRL